MIVWVSLIKKFYLNNQILPNRYFCRCIVDDMYAICRCIVDYTYDRCIVSNMLWISLSFIACAQVHYSLLSDTNTESFSTNKCINFSDKLLQLLWNWKMFFVFQYEIVASSENIIKVSASNQLLGRRWRKGGHRVAIKCNQ